MNKSKQQLMESARKNAQCMNYYTKRIINLALSRFKWDGDIPKTVDIRFLEMGLVLQGCGIYFLDDAIGPLSLWCLPGGDFNVYGIPQNRTAYGYGYTMGNLNDSNSVLIYNDMAHSTDCNEIQMFAERLYLCQRIEDININAQKTPVLFQCPETMRLTLENLFMKYDGNQPFIFGNSELAIPEMVRILKSDAPFLADKIRQERVEIWNELLTFLGIANMAINKRERMITDEVQRSMGATFSSRFTYEYEREQACDKIFELFGNAISVEFRQDLVDKESNAFIDEVIRPEEGFKA